MKISYKCKCMAKEVEIDVPDRRPFTDIRPWMEMVQGCMGYDHTALSPHCRRQEVEYCRIPIDEDSVGVGIPPEKD